MIRRPPRSTRTDTLFPYTTLFRSQEAVHELKGEQKKVFNIEVQAPFNVFIPNNFIPDHATRLKYYKRLSNAQTHRSEEHTSELQSLMRISYAVFCLKKKT